MAQTSIAIIRVRKDGEVEKVSMKKSANKLWCGIDKGKITDSLSTKHYAGSPHRVVFFWHSPVRLFAFIGQGLDPCPAYQAIHESLQSQGTVSQTLLGAVIACFDYMILNNVSFIKG